MSQRKVPPAGELRQSQLLSTFGPGAMVDLPHQSVLIGGLEQWQGERERILEERLEAWLREFFQQPELRLYAPPVDCGDPQAPRTGVTAFLFPIWFLGQVEKTYKDEEGRVYRTRPMLPWERLVKGGYLDEDKRVRPVVPIRFVQACVRGHISDVDWYAFVNEDSAASQAGELWLDEGGAGNDFNEIFVRDTRTRKRRPLSNAMVTHSKVLGTCRGRRPWLGPRDWEVCDKPNRLLTRSASNAYFAQTMGVISIPDTQQALREAVNRVWEDFLQYCEDERDVRRERRKEKVAVALEGFDDATVWQEVARRLQGTPEPVRGIKQVEIETFLAQQPAIGEDVPEGDFYARAHPVGELPPEASGLIDRLVLIHRLKEVTALMGFTRFEPPLTDLDNELDLEVQLAPLSRDLTWLPACENRGEGIFLSFREAEILNWLKRPGVGARGTALAEGFGCWAKRHGSKLPPPGLPYVMLHTLSHLLITALSLDCGYSASAIRERIYAGPSGYGILLYTGTAGSEGTLGGLVDVGRQLGRHITRALELGRLCSNDPVCAQHDPVDHFGERYLHGAACHGCLLIAETSCERRNELLDRALVIPTVMTTDAAFFGGGT